MRARRLGSAEEFLETTTALRAADPVRTNVLGSVATGVAEGRRYEHELWWVVEDDGGEVVGAALRTAPYKLLLGPMPPEAADALADDVVALGEAPPGLVGPAPVAARVAERAGWPTRVATQERILVLDALVPPVGIPGEVRAATEADVDLGAAWVEQFARDADTFVPDPRESFVARLSGNRFWVVDDEPVSYAGHAPLVESGGVTVARVGPVYTPAEHRRRGYGAAVTAAVTAELLEVADVVMLFTDAANPTSNGVYERLGYRVVG
ncbi:MAG: GNAT family N-acetyltransferase, partial [Candidatus Nanopelagicales bacterium]